MFLNMSLGTHLYAFLGVNLGVQLLCHRYPCVSNFRRCHVSYPSPPPSPHWNENATADLALGSFFTIFKVRSCRQSF